MDQLQGILENYRKLCAYCDGIWERVRAAYPNEIACRKGCSTCCELQSVNQLEAHVIRTYMYVQGIGPDKGLDDRKEGHICPFLRHHACVLYDARPIICRTHGLILRSNDFSQAHQAGSCPDNFPSYHPRDIPQEFTADIDNITKNLANLNIAFCMVNNIDIKDEYTSRVPLRELAALFG